LGVAVLVLAFVAITGWWLAVDSRVPDYDTGRHLGFALDFRDALGAGDLAYPFTAYTQYPPLVHLVGALALLLGPASTNTPIIAQNLVFVPLLALGCYGTGRVAYGRTVGLLAVVFALATPLVIDQFHGFLVDAPAAAMVAVTVWLVLASDRFARWPVAAAAGLAAGLGLLSKPPFALFIAGVLGVAVLRGGWRNWRGLVAFAAVALVVAGPWYVRHWGQLSGLTHGALAAPPLGQPDAIYPQRLSRQNLFWYFWNLLNTQVLLPLAIFAGIGTAAAAVRFLRRREPSDYSPELIAGALAGYLGVTYIALKDARYALGLTAYLAVLGTWWVVRLPRRWRTAAVAALLGVLVLNTLTVSFGVGSVERVAVLPNPPPTGPGWRQVTLWGHGYVLGGPDAGVRADRILKAAKREGVPRVAFEAVGPPLFNGSGLSALARTLEIQATAELGRIGPRDLLLVAHAIDPAAPPPCAMLQPGVGIYGMWGFPANPFRASAFHCPGQGRPVQP
jgi:hypothetical protein